MRFKLVSFLLICISISIGLWPIHINNEGEKRYPASLSGGESCLELFHSFMQEGEASDLKELVKEFEGLKGFKDFDFEVYRKMVLGEKELDGKSIESKLALIERINRENNYYLFEDNALIELKRLTNLKRVMSVLKHTSFSKDWNKEMVYYFVSNFYFLINKGMPGLSFFKFRRFSLSKKMVLSRMASEQILNEGVLKILKTFPEGKKGIRATIKKKWRKATYHPLFKVLQTLVLMPPGFRNVKIPDELLQKLVLEGYEKHQDEFIKIIRKQIALERYRDFKKIYNFAWTVVMAYQGYLLYQHIDELIDEKIKENTEEFKQNFKLMSTQIKKLVGKKKTKEELDNELKDEIMQMYYNEFQQENGRDPTPAEIKSFQNEFYLFDS